MSNEHTNNEPNHNTDHGRRRKRKPRTIRWYHDSQVGPEDMKGYTLARFFISIANDETPEVFLVLMNREPVEREDGSVGMKPTYAGDIERNAIPLSALDLDSLWNSLVTVKARMQRLQAERHAANGREVTLPPVTSQPKRSQQPTQPLTQRLSIPKAVLRQIKDTPAPQPTTHETAEEADSNADSSSLAGLLKGW